MTANIYHGSCLDVLREMPDNSVDSIATDPPYGLSNTSPQHVVETMREWANGNTEYVPAVSGGFMGAAWDAFVPPPAVWAECYRVLKPGGHLATFSGTRTIGLMDTSVRLAGFDHRDTIGAALAAWVTGQGFPKSLNIGKATGNPAHEGLGTALKPSWEPILLYRKPLGERTVAANTLTWGTGGLNIDKTRIGTTDKVTNHSRGATSAKSKGIYGDSTAQGEHQTPGQSLGRWPANVVLDPDTAKALDQQSGTSKPKPERTGRKGGSNPNPMSWDEKHAEQTGKWPADPGGGASRFFKVVEPDPPFMYAAKAPKKERPRYEDEQGNVIQHPTCKPLSIMKWLIRLTCPEGGTVLDPFAGSGTTVEAAILEGFNVIGIEREAEYLPLIQQRIDRATPTDPEPVDDLLGLLDGAA